MQLVDKVFRVENPYELIEQCSGLLNEFSGRKTTLSGVSAVNSLFDTASGVEQAEEGEFDDPNDEKFIDLESKLINGEE